MKRAVWILLLAGVASALPASEARRVERSIPVEPETAILIRGPAASLVLRPGAGDRVAYDLRVLCSGELISCRRDAERVALTPSRRDGELVLDLAGPLNFMRPDSKAVNLHCPTLARIYSVRAGKFERGTLFGLGKPGYKMSVTLTLRYPERSRLALDLEVGHVSLSDPRASVAAHLGRGVVGLVASRGVLGAVDARASRAELRLPRQEESRAGRRVRWQGPGAADLSLSVGKGFAVVEVMP